MAETWAQPPQDMTSSLDHDSACCHAAVAGNLLQSKARHPGALPQISKPG